MSHMHLLLLFLTFPPATSLQLTAAPDRLWSEQKIVEFMKAHPNRAYFTHMMRDGGFQNGMEVGVAGGRFSELFLKEMSKAKSKKFSWHLVEPFPNSALISRFPDAKFGVGPKGEKRPIRPQPWEETSTWASRGVGQNVDISYHKNYSTDQKLLDEIPDHSLDFVYLDGAHYYRTVKEELDTILVKMAPGAVLAGHDYCNYGEKPLECKNCEDVPRCGEYTEYATKKGKANVDNQADVVQAVHEFALAHPDLHLYHTLEDFTRESLAKDGFDYDEVITSSRNPSWFFVLPK